MKKLIECNRVQLHYIFSDNSHSMNAIVFNHTEYEVLCLLKEFSSKLKMNIEIETEPIENGSLRSWLRIKSNGKNITIADSIKIAFIIYLLTTVLGTPISTSLEYLTQKCLEYIFENEEIRELKEKKEIAELKLDIAKLEAETRKQAASIDENVVKKKTSNFYTHLSSYRKVTEFSVLTADNDKNILDEIKVEQALFDSFVLDTDELEPETDENAIIEIISPVLKKGKHRWMGYYHGDPITFTMKSNEFKTLVLLGDVSFKNGSTIDCQLEKNKRIDKNGNVYIYKYSVLLVNKYYENDKPIETYEGRKKRQKIEADKRQFNLFDDVDF